MTKFQNLSALVKAGKIEKGQRPYKVTANGKTQYVISTSPKSAAFDVCEVETVKQKELLQASLDALKEQQQGDAKKTA